MSFALFIIVIARNLQTKQSSI